MTKRPWKIDPNQLLSMSSAASFCGYRSRQAFAYALAALAGPPKIMIDGHPFLDRRELTAWTKTHKRKLKPPAEANA